MDDEMKDKGNEAYFDVIDNSINVSEAALRNMDKAIENYKKGKVSQPIDLPGL